MRFISRFCSCFFGELFEIWFTIWFSQKTEFGSCIEVHHVLKKLRARYEKRDRILFSILEKAVEHGDVEGVRNALIRVRAEDDDPATSTFDVNFKKQNSDTLLRRLCDCRNKITSSTTVAVKAQIADLLLQANADVEDRRERCGSTLLMSAVAGYGTEHEHDPELIRTLLKHGADVNARNAGGATPLHVAAANANPNLTKLLVEAKAEVNAADRDENTALHWLATHHIWLMMPDEDEESHDDDDDAPLRSPPPSNAALTATARHLLSSGIDPLRVNKGGYTALHRAAQRMLLRCHDDEPTADNNLISLLLESNPERAAIEAKKIRGAVPPETFLHTFFYESHEIALYLQLESEDPDLNEFLRSAAVLQRPVSAEMVKRWLAVPLKDGGHVRDILFVDEWSLLFLCYKMQCYDWPEDQWLRRIVQPAVDAVQEAGSALVRKSLLDATAKWRVPEELVDKIMSFDVLRRRTPARDGHQIMSFDVLRQLRVDLFGHSK